MKKRLKKVAIIGHFGFGYSYLDGQTVKTKILAEELTRRFGEEEVSLCDTHGGIRVMPKILVRVLSALKNHENVIILPAHNGLRVIAPWLSLWNRFFKRKTHYSVIGGWLPELLKNKRGLAKTLRTFSGIYVETQTMCTALKELQFSNVFVMKNFKKLDILPVEELSVCNHPPYMLCMFSRVMKEKGVEDAIEAIQRIHDRENKRIFTLDIYGPVDPEQAEWFDTLKTRFPEWVTYGGTVPFDKSVEVLKKYHALLFPTRFYTEGVPGTVIDAYAAGIPVVSSRWENFSDVIDEGLTGFGYEFGSVERLTQCLESLYHDNSVTLEIKKNCLEKAEFYLPQSAVDVLVGNM